MKATKLTDKELRDAGVCALPSRPTAPKSLGGGGYTPTQMKEAFDALPLFIKDRLNLLIDSICAVGEDSLANQIPTGRRSNHTLTDLFNDISTGAILGYIKIDGESLYSLLSRLKRGIDSEAL